MGIRLVPPGTQFHPPGPIFGRDRTFSRRGVLGAASSLGLIAAGARLARPVAAAGTGPKPIPGTIDPFKSGGAFHVNLPPVGDPSTFTDWRGTVGVVHVGGMGTVVRAGSVAAPPAGSPAAKPVAVGDRLTFDADMRFMQGTFGFIWFDLFQGAVAPDLSNQVYDFNPGILPNGLFWTVPIPAESVMFDLGTGVAEWHQHDVPVSDYHSLSKSLGNTPGRPVAPAMVSFDIAWGSPKATRQISDEKDKFAGTFANGVASVSFTAQTGDFYFVSDPGTTSQSELSWLGYETAGVYYPTPLATPTS